MTDVHIKLSLIKEALRAHDEAIGEGQAPEVINARFVEYVRMTLAVA